MEPKALAAAVTHHVGPRLADVHRCQVHRHDGTSVDRLPEGAAVVFVKPSITDATAYTNIGRP